MPSIASRITLFVYRVWVLLSEEPVGLWNFLDTRETPDEKLRPEFISLVHLICCLVKPRVKEGRGCDHEDPCCWGCRLESLI